jgi:hypothetical protein
VSITRQGVIATNISLLGAADNEVAVAIFGDNEDSAREGCQNNGAGQFLSGAVSDTACALSAITDKTIKDTLRLK